MAALKCPVCGAPSHVLDTRWDDKKNIARRRRWCPECKAVFTTTEAYIENPHLGRPKKKEGEYESVY